MKAHIMPVVGYKEKSYQGSTSRCWRSWLLSVWTARGLQKEEVKKTHIPLIIHLIVLHFSSVSLYILEPIFCETTQGRGMGTRKEKTAKASIYSRKKWKKRRGD
jgi:hypothetical protein